MRKMTEDSELLKASMAIKPSAAPEEEGRCIDVGSVPKLERTSEVEGAEGVAWVWIPDETPR